MAACTTDLLTTRWDVNYIALGTLISVIAAFTGLTQATYAFTVLRKPELRYWYSFYSVNAGISIGGGAIFVMHFVGMQALHIATCDGIEVPHKFNIALTVTSLVAACAIGGLCMYLVMPVGSAADAKASAGIPESPFWKLPCTLRGRALYVGKFAPKRFALATVALVMGVLVMHNMGLVAMYGPYYVEYDVGIVFGSAVLALVASAAGLFIVVQCAYVGAAWYSLLIRGIAALVVALAVNAVHYTGMSAASYHYTGDYADNLMHRRLGKNVRMEALVVLMAALILSVAQLLGTHAHIAHLARIAAGSKVAPGSGLAAAATVPPAPKPRVSLAAV